MLSSLFSLSSLSSSSLSISLSSLSLSLSPLSLHLSLSLISPLSLSLSSLSSLSPLSLSLSAVGHYSCLSLLGGRRQRVQALEGFTCLMPQAQIIAQQNMMKSVNLLLHLLYLQHLSVLETVPEFRERGRKDGPHKNMRRTRVPVMLQLYTRHESDVLIY